MHNHNVVVSCPFDAHFRSRYHALKPEISTLCHSGSQELSKETSLVSHVGIIHPHIQEGLLQFCPLQITDLPSFITT